MKRIIVYIFIAVILGSVCGNILFNKYDKVLAFSRNQVFFIEEGIYTDLKSLNSNTKNINPKLIVKENNKYHLYVGITSCKKGVNKIKKTYKNKGYNVVEKVVDVEDDGFLTNLVQYDILLDSAKTSEDILTIEEVVLSNYEEIIKK